MLMGLTAFIAGAMVATLRPGPSGAEKPGRQSVGPRQASVDSEHRIRALEAEPADREAK